MMMIQNEKKNFQLFFIEVIIVFSFPNHSKSVMFYSHKRKNSAYFSIQFFKFNHLLFFIFQLWNFEKKFSLFFHYPTIFIHTHTQRIVYCQFDSRNRISFRIMTITHTHTHCSFIWMFLLLLKLIILKKNSVNILMNSLEIFWNFFLFLKTFFWLLLLNGDYYSHT